MDQGYAIVVIQLPQGSSLSRTDAVTGEAAEIIQATPGVRDAVAFAGFSGATFTSSSDAAVVFAGFEPFEERLAQGITSDAIIGNLFGRMQAVEEAFIIAVPPPPVAGVGSAGGFKLQLRDLNSAEMDRVLQAAYAIMGQAAQTPGVTGVFTTFSNSSPQFYLEDRKSIRLNSSH